ncbi:DUF3592 domain-containing protein [Actinomadura harenae]|uniref:DUF3592 domain-containing protein n=1 Tax=Actinomadura harenae TaxID=2483351 RepID=A0A3M2MAL1_9ACTN|nr:DUF3592 domain-containing protein [Actinomadura harenae]RMI46521.1 DUF3592 domain-containing protein [Actinomadura harenae]
MSTHQLLPPAFALLGLLFAGAGVYSLRTTRYLRRKGHRVPGLVHALNFERNSEGGGNHYPVLHFHTLDGSFVMTTSDVGTNPARSRAGDRVVVVYDPDRPDRARPENLLGVGTVMGVVFLLLGLAVCAVASLITANVYS